MKAPMTLSGEAPPWAHIADAAVITAEMAEVALTELELRHTEYVGTQRAAAERLERLAVDLGRADLRRRARLVIADGTIRSGEPVVGSSLVRALQTEAEAAGDAFALARAHFLLAWISQAIGDMPAAQINGVRSVELLPDSVPRGIVIDHLMILAIAYNPAPEASRYFSEVLAIAHEYDDPVRTVTIHNNIAYAALERGNLLLAADHVTQMLAEAARHDIALGGSQLDTAARVYNETGRYDDAIALLAAVDRAADADDADVPTLVDTQSHAFPIGMLTLAQSYLGKGDAARAWHLLNRSAAAAQRDGLRGLAAQIGRERSKLYATSGDFERAFREYVAFHEATVALQSEDQAARARIVQASFDAERNRQQAEHFRELAMRDALTGLYNRRFMDELAQQTIARAAQTVEPISLAIIDADHFKRVNDELSHEVGDEALRLLARVLLHSRPPGSTICRLGGEEFVLVWPDADVADAVAGCEEMRRAVAEYDWSATTGSLPLTVSIGVATAHRGETTVSALLSDADRHLYEAKRSGRNRVVGAS